MPLHRGTAASAFQDLTTVPDDRRVVIFSLSKAMEEVSLRPGNTEPIVQDRQSKVNRQRKLLVSLFFDFFTLSSRSRYPPGWKRVGGEVAGTTVTASTAIHPATSAADGKITPIEEVEKTYHDEWDDSNGTEFLSRVVIPPSLLTVLQRLYTMNDVGKNKLSSSTQLSSSSSSSSSSRSSSPTKQGRRERRERGTCISAYEERKGFQSASSTIDILLSSRQDSYDSGRGPTRHSGTGVGIGDRIGDRIGEAEEGAEGLLNVLHYLWQQFRVLYPIDFDGAVEERRRELAVMHEEA